MTPSSPPVDANPEPRDTPAMHDPLRPYRQLARNNLLANRRLHTGIAALHSGEWVAPRVGFFPSLCDTLNHIHVIDLFYIDAMQGGTLGPVAWADPIPYPDPAALAAAQTALDQTLITLVIDLSAPDLQRPVHIHRTGRIQTETLADTLMHLFLHDQHHRGQAHAMLSGTTIAPPQLDEFVMADDDQFRTADLAALGWTETTLRG
jgi:uncharacterized damage-inducible protein DinB